MFLIFGFSLELVVTPHHFFINQLNAVFKTCSFYIYTKGPVYENHAFEVRFLSLGLHPLVVWEPRDQLPCRGMPSPSTTAPLGPSLFEVMDLKALLLIAPQKEALTIRLGLYDQFPHWLVTWASFCGTIMGQWQGPLTNHISPTLAGLALVCVTVWSS